MKFTIRNLLWLVIVSAVVYLLVATNIAHRNRTMEKDRSYDSLRKEFNKLQTLETIDELLIPTKPPSNHVL